MSNWYFRFDHTRPITVEDCQRVLATLGPVSTVVGDWQGGDPRDGVQRTVTLTAPYRDMELRRVRRPPAAKRLRRVAATRERGDLLADRVPRLAEPPWLAEDAVRVDDEVVAREPRERIVVLPNPRQYVIVHDVTARDRARIETRAQIRVDLVPRSTDLRDEPTMCGTELVAEQLADALQRTWGRRLGVVVIVVDDAIEPFARRCTRVTVRCTAQKTVVIVATAFNDGAREILAGHRNLDGERVNAHASARIVTDGRRGRGSEALAASLLRAASAIVNDDFTTARAHSIPTT